MKNELFERGVEKIIGREEIEKKIKAGKILRIKHGVDPTTADLHLGYTVCYLKLKEFQDLGHKIIFLIGDFTGRFGDPTDKMKSRTLRSKKEVMALAKKYIEQVGKIINIKKTEIRYNGSWYDKMSAEDLIQLMSRTSHAEVIERDMFQERIKKDERIGLHELVYPLLQGYDSVVLESDLTVCGSDQLFNEMQGRKLQEQNGQVPQSIITVPLLIGTDGKQKMSQSLGNFIGISESPRDQFGKVMSIPDNLIFDYFTLTTRVPLEKIEELKGQMSEGRNPKEIKMILAKEIVKMYHGEKTAEKAEEEFANIFQKKELPTDITEFALSGNFQLPQLLIETNLAPSNSEARRLVKAGAVEIDGTKLSDFQVSVSVHSGMIIKVGKRRYARIK